MRDRPYLRRFHILGGGALFFLAIWGCESPDPADGFYALAADALGPEAHQDRTMVVNPLFLAPENPRIPETALQFLRDMGVEIMGPEGMEDPEKATLYFRPPETLEDGRYGLDLYVSLGARPGRMRRGDSWWRAVIECVDTCSVTEVASITPPAQAPARD